jgi:hypothetical protein
MSIKPEIIRGKAKKRVAKSPRETIMLFKYPRKGFIKWPSHYQTVKAHVQIARLEKTQ